VILNTACRILQQGTPGRAGGGELRFINDRPNKRAQGSTYGRGHNR